MNRDIQAFDKQTVNPIDLNLDQQYLKILRNSLISNLTLKPHG